MRELITEVAKELEEERLKDVKRYVRQLLTRKNVEQERIENSKVKLTEIETQLEEISNGNYESIDRNLVKCGWTSDCERVFQPSRILSTTSSSFARNFNKVV